VALSRIDKLLFMLNLQQDSSVTTLTLANPQRRNAMTRQMWRDLQRLCTQLSAQPPAQTRCLVIRGEGDHFCAGGDISEYPSFRFDEKKLAHFHEQEVAPALEALLALDIPIVAMLAGNCIGGGLEIACCADIRIAGQGAVFGAPIAKLGMPMAPRELAIVARSAGQATTREMLLEARLLDAPEMKARGWLQRVVSDELLAQEVAQTAQRIAQLSPQAARLNKQVLRQFSNEKWPLAGINIEEFAIDNIANRVSQNPFDAPIYGYAQSAEHVEGITAFLEKRTPQF
jgi:enoyl-CoA hydratase/carnithine racemase